MNRQTTLRPSQGGKFHPPVGPSQDMQTKLAKQDASEIRSAKLSQDWLKYAEEIKRSPWKAEYPCAFGLPNVPGPKSKEVEIKGKKFIVYSA